MALEDFKFVNEVSVWRYGDAFVGIPSNFAVELLAALSIFGGAEEFQVFSDLHLKEGKLPALRALVAAKLK